MLFIAFIISMFQMFPRVFPHVRTSIRNYLLTSQKPINSNVKTNFSTKQKVFKQFTLALTRENTRINTPKTILPLVGGQGIQKRGYTIPDEKDIFLPDFKRKPDTQSVEQNNKTFTDGLAEHGEREKKKQQAIIEYDNKEFVEKIKKVVVSAVAAIIATIIAIFALVLAMNEPFYVLCAFTFLLFFGMFMGV